MLFGRRIPRSKHGAVREILAAPTLEPFVHPYHRPAGYVANLRGIFDSLAAKCATNCNGTTGTGNANATQAGSVVGGRVPVKHPGNKVFPSFGAYARSNCGGQCQRPEWVVPSPNSVKLAARLLEHPGVTMDFEKYWPRQPARSKRPMPAGCGE